MKHFSLEDLSNEVSVKVVKKYNLGVKPADIKAYLDEYVIGQEYAKKILAIAAVNHEAAVEYNMDNPKEVPIKASNVLLTGPSGSGKTLLVETLARKLNRPYVVQDITHFSPTGYKGRDVNSILYELIEAADGDEYAASQGIIFIDEVDKISSFDNSGESFGSTQIQRSLLKMVEGAVISVSDPSDRKTLQFPTHNILWIFGGSFDKFHTHKKKSVEKKSVGFVNTSTVKQIDIDHQFLIEAGMLRELVGRIGQVVELQPLTKADYKRILVEPKNSPIHQLTKIAEVRGIDLTFSDEDIDAIVEKAFSMEVGARALKILAENTMIDKLF